MQRKLSPNERKLRLERLYECLRYFSLSPGDCALNELLGSPQLPTEEQIQQRLAQDNILEGRPFTPAYVAKAVVKALTSGGPKFPEHFPVDDEATYRLADQQWYGPLPKDEEKTASETDKLSVDVVLLTAVRPELEAVLRCFQPLPNQQFVWRVVERKETYYVGSFGEQTAVVTMCRMGHSDQGASFGATFKAIDRWRPKAVIMVGIAFGKDPEKQAIADVLVSSQVICYGQRRVGKGNKVVYRGPITPCGAALLNRFRNELHWQFLRPDGTECGHKDGPILSGEVLVDDPEFKAKLFQEYPQAIGGEMEAVGIYAASAEWDLEWIIVKAICDWADGDKGKADQPLAAAAAVSLVHSVLSRRLALADLRRPL